MGPWPGLESRRSSAPTGDGDARPIVVCVDDEAQILRSISRLVRREDYDLRATTDPEEALDWVRKEKVALLIADYRMPTMSGMTLLQLVKAYSPRTARLLLTGYPGESMVIAAGGAGLLDIVGKPWDDEALKGKIRSLLAGGGDQGA
jgi:DNA-binding NtrC family response regulator